MIHPRLYLVALWSLIFATGTARPLNACTSAQAFSARDGLPNFAHKLRSEEKIRLAFLGGSRTANENGFTGQMPKWLRENHPNAWIEIVNAGVSGTPSRFGAQRLDRDVLSVDPDLIFVEFAVNDGVSDATRHMERIVRKAWTDNPETDLVFIYTLNASSHLTDYEKGCLPPATASHEAVAAHYGIPSINMAYFDCIGVRDGSRPFQL